MPSLSLSLYIYTMKRRSTASSPGIRLLSSLISQNFLWCCCPKRATDSSVLRFLNHTQRRNTAGRTPLGELKVHCRDLYLTTHNPFNLQTFRLTTGFEPTVSGSERPQTCALDHTATGTGISQYTVPINLKIQVNIQ